MLCGRFSSNRGQAATPPAQAGRGGLPTRPWISLGHLGRFVFEGHCVFAGMILVGAGNGYRLFAKLRAFQHSGLVLRRLAELEVGDPKVEDRKSTRLNSSHRCISYAVFCLKKKNTD